MTDRLPNARELPRQAAHPVMLGSIGSLLRAHYEDLRSEPVPESLREFIRQLAEQDPSPTLMRGR